MDTPTIIDIKKAQERIQQDADLRTKIVMQEALNMKFDFPIYIKPEGLQPTGSFKIRGALNKILKMQEGDIDKQYITASAGNHAIGLAYSSRLVGVSSFVVVSKKTPQIKFNSCKKMGANVIITGENYDEAYKEARRISSERQYYYIHPVSDCDVVAGQGTIGLEILDEIPDVEQVIVPIGGGGLISGIAIAIKSIKPEVKIIGVQPGGSKAYYESWKRGELIQLQDSTTIADGLSLKAPEEYLFNLIKQWVDDILYVKESTIKKAIKDYMFLGKLLIEGSGAVTLASIIEGKINTDKKTVVIGSGSNIDEKQLRDILG